MAQQPPLTVAQVADRLGWTVSKTRRAIAAERLVPSFRVAGPTGAQLFTPEVVEAFAAEIAAELQVQLDQLQPRDDATEMAS